MLTIKDVSTARDRKEFIEFPLRLYKDCPYFVPPLYRDEKKLLRSGDNAEIAESVFSLQKEMERQLEEYRESFKSSITKFTV